jgi:hypothetical protein
VITIIAIIFNKYLWQLSIFKNWLVLVPNLNGKWRGVINPDWVSPITKEKSEPIETSLSIKQSLVHISCVMITSEMKSHSITYDFMIDASNQVLKLGYIYMSEPNLNVREKSQIHYGTTIFDIVKLEDNHIQLKGGYWTDRKTSGTINLSKD